eukprot:TRINITY_DN12055_c0_g1_i1.p1 TRINITY_DN12055_c0_g1~~TRINITY_DN12055_c0_g1_i1.p1  ORF type:complete len:141 (-),score=1.45 TRINITY_DN12055_c0_g1_i1:137-559(-)
MCDVASFLLFIRQIYNRMAGNQEEPERPHQGGRARRSDAEQGGAGGLSNTRRQGLSWIQRMQRMEDRSDWSKKEVQLARIVEKRIPNWYGALLRDERNRTRPASLDPRTRRIVHEFHAEIGTGKDCAQKLLEGGKPPPDR